MYTMYIKLFIYLELLNSSSFSAICLLTQSFYPAYMTSQNYSCACFKNALATPTVPK